MSDHETGITIRQLLEHLTGQPATCGTDLPVVNKTAVKKLGFSQLNELLILLGFDRINEEFFRYLATAGQSPNETNGGTEFKTIGELEQGVDKFRAVALVVYGNVKYGFKILSQDAKELEHVVALTAPLSDISIFKNRHGEVFPRTKLDPKETYLLGYIVDDEQIGTMADSEAKSALIRRRDSARLIGSQNHLAYLASDHLDVYVATSMRKRHEYTSVARITDAIFADEIFKDMNLRFFDPTQAYCKNRIEKGIAEALMLKRAKCTLYLAQESDTLGKDSELASTLAQGKTVIAYVPKVAKGYAEEMVNDIHDQDESRSRMEIILEQLSVFKPEAAWDRNSPVRDWITQDGPENEAAALDLLQESIQAHYDKRAKTISEIHPLAIQVDLKTGVANGLLVARDIESCASLISNVMQNSLDLRLVSEHNAVHLKEAITQSIYRTMTNDPFLNNAFWNYYGSRAPQLVGLRSEANRNKAESRAVEIA